MSLPRFIPKLWVKMGVPAFPKFLFQCSQNPALQLNKVRFLFCFGVFFYFQVYRQKHGKSGAKKIRGGGGRKFNFNVKLFNKIL